MIENLDEIEKKILYVFQHTKEAEKSLKIKGIEKKDLEEYCRERLHRNDIEIKNLPTGGYYFKFDENIVTALNTILENRKTIKNSLV